MCADAIASLWPERADARSIPPLASRLAPNLVAHCCNDAGGKALPPKSPGRDRCVRRSQAHATIRPVTGLIHQLRKCLALPHPAYIVERFRGRRTAVRGRTGKLERT